MVMAAEEAETKFTYDISSGRMERMKRRGPSTEPWRTPCETRAVHDLDLLMLIELVAVGEV